MHNTSNPSKFVSLLFSKYRRILLLLFAILILVWALLPAARAVTLVINISGHSAPVASLAGIPVQNIQFQAIDGVSLSGWLATASVYAPTIILVHGFKSSRFEMLPYARFLYKGGYNVLL